MFKKCNTITLQDRNISHHLTFRSTHTAENISVVLPNQKQDGGNIYTWMAIDNVSGDSIREYFCILSFVILG